ELSGLRARQAAVRRAQEVLDFAAIDHAACEREVEALRLEKRRLEENDDTIRLLKGRLAAAADRQAELLAARDEAVPKEGELLRQIADAERLIANAEGVLRREEADGTLARHAETFPDLEACFREQPLTAGSLFEQAEAFRQARRAEADQLRLELDPLKA